MDWPDFNQERIGQLIMCQAGTCGNKEKNAAKVPLKKFKKHLKENGMSKYFKVTDSKCLGVCKPHNVSVVLSQNKQIWLGMLREETQYEHLLKWITASINARELLPLPIVLQEHVFSRFQ